MRKDGVGKVGTTDVLCHLKEFQTQGRKQTLHRGNVSADPFLDSRVQTHFVMLTSSAFVGEARAWEV